MIKTLIIMTTYGQIFYSKEEFFEQKSMDTDISLTAGLISAIYSMASEVQKEKIEELELERIRSIFKELPGEKLFIITVDKRMDYGDAQDMLKELSERFVDRYGDRMTDGLILNDFEPEVDEIVANRLWYNTTPKNPKIIDILPFLALLFSVIWYPYWLLQGKKTIIQPIQVALSKNIFQFLLELVLIGIATVLPIIVDFVLLSKLENMKKPLNYMKEFLRRPTRGGYAEVLPWWFVSIPILTIAFFTSIVANSRGFSYSFTLTVLSNLTINSYYFAGGYHAFWWIFGLYLVLYFITWYIITPLIAGLITQDLSKNWFLSTSILISLAMILFLPTQFISGKIYQEIIGYHPENSALYQIERESLQFLFLVTIPANLFLFAFIFFMGVGMNQLAKTKRSRFPIGFGIALFITLALQNVLFWLVFTSGVFNTLLSSIFFLFH